MVYWGCVTGCDAHPWLHLAGSDISTFFPARHVFAIHRIQIRYVRMKSAPFRTPDALPHIFGVGP